MYTVRCTLYAVRCTLYAVQCTVYAVHINCKTLLCSEMTKFTEFFYKNAALFTLQGTFARGESWCCLVFANSKIIYTIF